MRRTLTCTLVAGLFGCGSPPPDGPPPNVVVIVIDTARADHFSCWGYERDTTPNIDAFAREAVLYRHARAPSPWTLPSHASLFTGLPPGAHGLHWSGIPATGDSLPPRLSRLAPFAEERLLAVRLKELGYSTVGVSNNPWISGRNHLDRGFDHFVWRPAPKSGDHGRADRSLEVIRRHFESRSPPEPFFLFLNLIEPHFPYDPPPDFHGRFGGELGRVPEADKLGLAMLAGAVSPDPEVLKSLYDEELRYVDDAIGRLLGWLRETGRYDESLIVVTSDHGELIGEGGQYSHQLSVAPELIWIPLLVKYPRNEGAGRVEDNPLVSLTDVYRTVLRAAGDAEDSREPWSQDLSDMKRFARDWTITEYFFAVKYLRQLERLNPDFDRTPHEIVRRVVFADGEAHVVEGDELRPVGPELPAEVREELESYVRSLGATALDDSLGDAQTLEALRSLGYVD